MYRPSLSIIPCVLHKFHDKFSVHQSSFFLMTRHDTFRIVDFLLIKPYPKMTHQSRGLRLYFHVLKSVTVSISLSAIKICFFKTSALTFFITTAEAYSIQPPIKYSHYMMQVSKVIRYCLHEKQVLRLNTRSCDLHYQIGFRVFIKYEDFEAKQFVAS